MRPIYNPSSLTPVAIATAKVSLPFPPVVCGWVDHWNGEKSVPEFDLKVWANLATDLSAAELFGGVPEALAIADDDVNSVTHGSDTLTVTTHGYLNGDGPLRLTNVGGALPAGLATGTDYWVIYVDANTIKLATSLQNALAGTAIDLTGNGTGTHTISDTSSTKRVRWNSCGLLGPDADGVVALGPQRALIDRFLHSPEVVAYAISATLTPDDPEAVSAAATPIMES